MLRLCLRSFPSHTRTAAQEYFFPSVNVLAIVLPIVFILLLVGLIVFLVWFCCYRDGTKTPKTDSNKPVPMTPSPKPVPPVVAVPTEETLAQKRSRELKEKNERARQGREHEESLAAAGRPSPPTHVASGARSCLCAYVYVCV